MHLLILGGTRFVGRYIVEAAQAAGHEVTLFNRGRSNPRLFSDVETLIGDRDGDLAALEGRQWDAVVDTSGYVPRVVRDSAELLADAAPHYTFISTISVYDDSLSPDAGEDAALQTLEDETVEEIAGGTYGALKVLCENVVQELYPDGALVIRPGLIVGPHDPTDRFTYWPVRVAEGGQVLAPGVASKPVQFIDVRDLGEWIMRMVEARATGIYNATGPAGGLPLGEVLAACRKVTHSTAQFEWVEEEFLLEHDVQPFTEMPLWIPGQQGLALGTINIQRALIAGLKLRKVEETVEDTLEWAQTLPDDHEWRAGMDRKREAELLQAWYARQSEEQGG